MKIRLKFTKQGVIKYIGHLDVMRYFQKAFRRTDIQICYSTGFSPHQIMSFASPLGVGLESIGEYFDVEVADNEIIETIPERLNTVMANGIHILGVTLLGNKAKNGMASVQAADYLITFCSESPVNQDIIHLFHDASEILFTKETKSGHQTFDMKPYVFELSLTSNGCLFMRTDASSSGNIKPAYVIEALLKLDHKEIKDNKYHILRQEIYQRNQMNELVSLGMNIDDEDK